MGNISNTSTLVEKGYHRANNTMSARRKCHPYKIMSEDIQTPLRVNITEPLSYRADDDFENVSDVSSDLTDNSVEYQNYPEESRLHNAYQMMLMRIFLSIQEQNLPHSEMSNDHQKPIDLSGKPYPFMVQCKQENPLDLSTSNVSHNQNIMMSLKQNISSPHQINHIKVTENQMKPQPMPKQSIKRPMNAFMIWAKTERRNLQRIHPDLDNCSISKILGTRWKEMEGEEKQFYYEQQAALAKLHMEKYPGYKYRPRQKRVCMLAGRRVTVKEFKQWNKKKEESMLEHQPIDMS